MATNRTTHRSSARKKLYAVRDKSGKFKDIQTYERAHRADLAKDSKPELAKKEKSIKATQAAKPKSVPKPKAAVKPKVAKKAVLKKAVIKKATPKKTAPKKAVKK